MTWADTRYHPEDRCALCGASEKETSLKQCWVITTAAKAWRCVDDIACLRRVFQSTDLGRKPQTPPSSRAA